MKTTSPTQFAAAALAVVAPVAPRDRQGNVVRGRSKGCWLCGGPTCGRGWRHADAIAPTFTQHNRAILPDSDAVCEACVACIDARTFQTLVQNRGLAVKLWPQAGWHSYSHVVTAEGGYEAPVPARIRDILLMPPSPPFLIGLNPSGQKHSLFRSRISTSRDLFAVHYDDRTIRVDRGRFAAILADVERASELGISKEQAASGRYHPESMRRAGLASWRAVEDRLRAWRATDPDLLVLAAWVGRGPKWFAGQREDAA